VVLDRDRSGLDALDLPGTEIIRLACDLSAPAAIDAAFADLTNRGIVIDEMFACAGIGARGPVATIDPETDARVIRINTEARIRLVHKLLPGMLDRQFGRLVLISSSSAFQPLPLMASYAASNAAVLLFGEALSEELAGDGIEVLVVCPGGMKTAFQQSSGVREIEGEKLMAPETVAERAFAALGHDRMTIFPSFRPLAMASLARLLPRRLSVKLWGRMMRKLR